MTADGRRIVRHRDAADPALILPLGNHRLRILGLVHLDAGLAIKNPPKKIMKIIQTFLFQTDFL